MKEEIRRAHDLAVLTRLLARFAPKIVIDVESEAFTFRRGTTAQSVPTVLWLVDGPKGRRIEAFGNERSRSGDATEVRLFAGRSPAPGDPDLMMELMTRFLRYGFTFVVPGRIFLRPHVRFRGIERLEPRLGGFQANLLRSASMLAGAGVVVFED